jgi:alkylhydroperoxidase AhpD family core domain
MAASPQLVDGFLKLTAIFENTALEPVAREVLVMTVATRNRCHICVAMHTARLTALGADPGLIEALRDADRAEPLPDERLDAVRVFTLRVLDTAGDVGDRALRDFLAAGYTTQNALESCSASAPTRCPPWPTGSPERPWTTSWPPTPERYRAA